MADASRRLRLRPSAALAVNAALVLRPHDSSPSRVPSRPAAKRITDVRPRSGKLRATSGGVPGQPLTRAEVSARAGREVLHSQGRTIARCGAPKPLHRLDAMSMWERTGTRARRALWFGGLLVLLAGIVGMHGLNSHAGGMDPAAHTIVLHDAGAAAVATSGHQAMAAAVHEVVGPAVTLAASAVAVPESGMDAGMAGMCMAVLALALTLVLRMLCAAPAIPLYRLVGAPVRRLAPHARDPDPPLLIQLSIQRC